VQNKIKITIHYKILKLNWQIKKELQAPARLPTYATGAAASCTLPNIKENPQKS